MFLQKQRNYNNVGDIKKYVFAYNGNKKDEVIQKNKGLISRY